MRGAFAKLGRCRQFQHPASSPQPPESNREPRRFVRARLQSCRGRRKFLPALAAEAMFLRLSCRVLIPHPLSPRQNPKISNREAQRLEIQLTHTKQTTQRDSNRENNACISTTKMGRLTVREDHAPQNPHRLRPETARKTNSPPSTFVSARKKSALYFVQVTEFPIEPMFRLEKWQSE